MDPRNLCILVPDEEERELSDIQIQVPVDRQIVGIISRLDLRSTSSGHPFEGGRNNQGLERGQKTMSSLTTFQDQSDQRRMSHGVLTEAQVPEPEDTPLLSEEELAWNECIGAWTDGQSDAQDCGMCENAIEDSWDQGNEDTNESEERHLGPDLRQEFKNDRWLAGMQRDTDGKEMIAITSFPLNNANIKLERLCEPECYFHPIGYELGFLREYDDEPGPTMETIMRDSWNKFPRLEILKNLLGRVLARSFSLLNRAMKTEPRCHKLALTGALYHIRLLMAKFLKVCTWATQSQVITESRDSEPGSNCSRTSPWKVRQVTYRLRKQKLRTRLP
jgi:hypothetical protein